MTATFLFIKYENIQFFHGFKNIHKKVQVYLHQLTILQSQLASRTFLNTQIIHFELMLTAIWIKDKQSL
jgi:hypothetical protein